MIIISNIYWIMHDNIDGSIKFNVGFLNNNEHKNTTTDIYMYILCRRYMYRLVFVE